MQLTGHHVLTPMENVEVFLIGLFVAVAAVTSLARAISVPYPIVLVLAGLLLGFLPGVPGLET